VRYAVSRSTQKPIRSVSALQSSRNSNTDSRQRWLNSAIPNSSISCFEEMPSCCSTAISTGRPWQSQPPRRSTSLPRMVW
jgi:hypothetical protein